MYVIKSISFKFLMMSNFSFCQIFSCHLLQMRQIASLCGKGLWSWKHQQKTFIKKKITMFSSVQWWICFSFLKTIQMWCWKWDHIYPCHRLLTQGLSNSSFFLICVAKTLKMVEMAFPPCHSGLWGQNYTWLAVVWISRPVVTYPGNTLIKLNNCWKKHNRHEMSIKLKSDQNIYIHTYIGSDDMA